MPVFRCTLGFRNGPFAPTETYYRTEANLAAVGPKIEKLMQLRNEMLTQTDQWVGVRIGQADAPRTGRLYSPGQYTLAGSGIAMVVPERGVLAVGTGQPRQDQGRSCIICKAYFGNSRTSTRYLSFVPDNVVRGDPDSVALGGTPFFSTDFRNFTLELVNGGWQIWARKSGSGFDPILIEDWVTAATGPSIMGPSIPTPTAPALSSTRRVKILSVRRRGTDKLSYNGTFVVQTLNTTQVPDHTIYFLRGTETGDPASIKLPGKLQIIDYQAYNISTFFAERAGIHKRGGSFGAVRGRRSKHLSLDP